jgi:short-subunit dehydrogenase
MFNNHYAGKVVIITGSSMGIGKSLALILGQHKAQVVLNGRDKEKLLATESELLNKGCKVMSFAGDVTNENDCRNMISAVILQFGKIDILVNNAGVSMRGKIEQLSTHVIKDIFNVNAVAPLILTQIALPYIKKTKGSIVFISSLAGLHGLPIVSVYSASKMALTAIAQSLRVEHYADEIHVGIIYVGITEIDKHKTAIDANGNKVLLEERKNILTSGVDHVAKNIAHNIAARKKKTTIGLPGKLYFFLTRYFPRVLEILLIRSQKKMGKLYK